jgi:hypothetical protein
MEHLRYSIRNQILFNQVGSVFKTSIILEKIEPYIVSLNAEKKQA